MKQSKQNQDSQRPDPNELRFGIMYSIVPNDEEIFEKTRKTLENLRETTH